MLTRPCTFNVVNFRVPEKSAAAPFPNPMTAADIREIPVSTVPSGSVVLDQATVTPDAILIAGVAMIENIGVPLAKNPNLDPDVLYRPHPAPIPPYVMAAKVEVPTAPEKFTDAEPVDPLCPNVNALAGLATKDPVIS